MLPDSIVLGIKLLTCSITFLRSMFCLLQTLLPFFPWLFTVFFSRSSPILYFTSFILLAVPLVISWTPPYCLSEEALANATASSRFTCSGITIVVRQQGMLSFPGSPCLLLVPMSNEDWALRNRDLFHLQNVGQFLLLLFSTLCKLGRS